MHLLGISAPRDLPLVTDGAVTVGDGVLAASQGGRVVFCQMAPWQFDYQINYGVKRTYRRTAFMANRLLGNPNTQASSTFPQASGKRVC
ncbi:hypothetical protein [Novipirellula artificiosorum]|uniref:hypothetical protein n=1 Tax=Novipirellula artificiosorum TaxID=2528016 RepID=UPI0011B71523|nr:hypothetical protein [Novipirellula artificiosorum]